MALTASPSLTASQPRTAPQPRSSSRIVADVSVRAATLRLSDEFPALGQKRIRLVVRTCREDLRGVPAGALPELVERLARQRLQAPPV